MKPHKHSEVIKAWADGHEIEFLTATPGGYWQDLKQPQWNENCEYRIKPAEPEREYPKTSLTSEELGSIVQNYSGNGTDSLRFGVANAVLRHACDKGQIVTRAEFDRAIGDRKARDIAIARAIDAWYSQTFPNKQRNSDNYLSEIINSVK